MLEFIEDINSEIPDDDSTSEGERMLLYWLIRELKPNVCVETGTHRGLSTLYMAQALLDNKRGIIITADPNTEWGARGNFRKFRELDARIELFEDRGDKIPLEGLRGIDFLFLDGLHEKEEVLSEMNHFIPYLHSRSVVVFHDCKQDNKLVGVNAAVKKLGFKTTALPTTHHIRIYSIYDPS